MNGRDDHLSIYRKTRRERSSGTGYYLCTAYALWCLENRDQPDWTFSEIAFLVYPNRSDNHHKLCKALREQVVERRGVMPTGAKRRGAVYRAEDLKDLLDDRGKARAQLLPRLVEVIRDRMAKANPGPALRPGKEKSMNALYGALSKLDPLDLEQVLIEVATGNRGDQKLSADLLGLTKNQCHYLLWMFGGEPEAVPVEEVVSVQQAVVEVKPESVAVKLPEKESVVQLTTPRHKPRTPWRVLLAAVAITAITVGWAAKTFYSPEEITKVYQEQGPDIASLLEVEQTPRGYLSKGHKLYASGDLGPAEKYVRKGMLHEDATFSDKATGLYYLGGIRFKQGAFDEAIALFSASAERYDRYGAKAAYQNYLNTMEIARARIMLGEHQAAIKLLNKAYDYYQHSDYEKKALGFPQWLRVKYRAHLELDERQEVLETTLELNRLVDPSDKRATAEALGVLGFAYALNNRLDQALQYTHQAETLFDGLAYEKGRVYLSLNRVVIARFQNADPTPHVQKVQRYLSQNTDWELSHYLDMVQEVQPAGQM